MTQCYLSIVSWTAGKNFFISFEKRWVVAIKIIVATLYAYLCTLFGTQIIERVIFNLKEKWSVGHYFCKSLKLQISTIFYCFFFIQSAHQTFLNQHFYPGFHSLQRYIIFFCYKYLVVRLIKTILGNGVLIMSFEKIFAEKSIPLSVRRYVTCRHGVFVVWRFVNT